MVEVPGVACSAVSGSQVCPGTIGAFKAKAKKKPKNNQRSVQVSSFNSLLNAAIEKVPFGSDYQTMRYTSIDDYVSTYKAISLKGFRVREASMPDGTEDRQKSILNLIDRLSILWTKSLL